MLADWRTICKPEGLICELGSQQMQYGGQIIGQPLQMQQQMSRGNSTMPLHPVQAANRNLLQQQQHGLGPNMGAGGLSGSPLTNGLQVCTLLSLPALRSWLTQYCLWLALPTCLSLFFFCDARERQPGPHSGSGTGCPA